MDWNDGGTDVVWKYCFTEDGDNWNTFCFKTLSKARKFAREVSDANEANREFAHFACRMMVVMTEDFFDESKPGGAVRLAPHLLPR